MVEARFNIARSCVVSQFVPTDTTPTALEVTETFITVALDNGEIHTYDSHGTDGKSLDGSCGAVWALASLRDLLASGGIENEVKIWDLTTGRLVRTLQGHTSTIRALQILSDGKRLVSASRDTTLRLWDLTSGQCIAVSTAHTGTIRSLVLSASEDLLVSGSYDGTACLWRIADKGLVCLHTLRVCEGPIYSVAFNDGAKQVITAGSDAQVKVWNQEDGQCIVALQGHRGIVNKMKLRGSKLVTSDVSGCICIWSLLGSTSLIRRFEAHPSSITSLDFDGSKVLSADTEGSVKLTNVENGELLGELSQDAESVRLVAFSSQNTVIAVSRREAKVAMEIWNIV